LSNQIILLSILFVVILGFSFQDAFAAVDMFLKIDGVDGESKDKDHGNEMDILSLSWSSSLQSSSTARAGSASVDKFSVTKYIDKATPKLLESLASGKHIEDAKIIVRKAGGNPVEYLKYTLRDIMVTSYSTGGSSGGDRPMEEVSFSYGKIEVEYTEITADGKAGKVTVQGWDTVKKQAYCPDAAGTCGDLPPDVFSPIEKDTIPKLGEQVKTKEPIKTETEEIRKITLPKDKEGSITLAGEIEFKQGVPLEFILEKSGGGESQAFTIMPEASGQYNTVFKIPKDLPAGQYNLKLSYDNKVVESLSLSIQREMVPSWIKNNAKWWSEKQIGDSDFISGIQFMIQEKIILVSGQPSGSAQTDTPVPGWVRNNAGWWADDLISEDEFVKALEFLIQNGIIRIS
jgi:type VI secretion system secreted protein Hcp